MTLSPLLRWPQKTQGVLEVFSFCLGWEQGGVNFELQGWSTFPWSFLFFFHLFLSPPALTWHTSNCANQHQAWHTFCHVLGVQTHSRVALPEHPTITSWCSKQLLISPLQLSTSTSGNWNPKTYSTPLPIHPITVFRIGRKNKCWVFSLSHSRIFPLLGFYPQRLQDVCHRGDL